jgi:hypothetical protein
MLGLTLIQLNCICRRQVLSSVIMSYGILVTRGWEKGRRLAGERIRRGVAPSELLDGTRTVSEGSQRSVPVADQVPEVVTGCRRLDIRSGDVARPSLSETNHIKKTIMRSVTTIVMWAISSSFCKDLSALRQSLCAYLTSLDFCVI